MRNRREMQKVPQNILLLLGLTELFISFHNF